MGQRVGGLVCRLRLGPRRRVRGQLAGSTVCKFIKRQILKVHWLCSKFMGERSPELFQLLACAFFPLVAVGVLIWPHPLILSNASQHLIHVPLSYSLSHSHMCFYASMSSVGSPLCVSACVFELNCISLRKNCAILRTDLASLNTCFF